MKKVFVTRKIPDIAISMLTQKGYEVDQTTKNRPLTKAELVKVLQKKQYDAVLSVLTDSIDAEVMSAAPSVKLFANYAIGFNNFSVDEAKKRGVALSNTPSGGAERVAEFTWALILALVCRIPEADLYVKKGKYKGWDPMLLHGMELAGKTLGIIGTGHIGASVVKRATRGFGMNVVYFDVVRNENLEKEYGAVFCPTVEDVLKKADIVSLHVPLLPSTHHLMNAERFALMKKHAILINTARGPIVDEKALADALISQKIAGAGIDVFEYEPKVTKALTKLTNTVLTPHIASASDEARHDMAVLAAQNIITFFETGKPVNPIITS